MQGLFFHFPGYTYGGEKNDDFEGVCSQIAPDCEDGMWGHLQTVNQYNGGAMSRWESKTCFYDN